LQAKDPNPPFLRDKMRSLVLASSIVPLMAHMTNVCSSTSPSQPGILYFWFGTYHSSIAGARGSVRITPPGGNELTFSLSGNGARTCSPSPRPNNAAQGNPEAAIKAGNCGIPSDAVVTCYGPGVGSGTGSASDPRPTSSTSGGAAFPSQSGAFGMSYNYAGAMVTASTGVYRVRTVGTDMNFDPCGVAAHPCYMNSGRYYNIGLAAAAGGNSCTGPPGNVRNMVPGSNCDEANFDGAMCNLPCMPDALKAGTVICADGVWTNSQTCTYPEGHPLANGDPHLTLPHGGKADFRGEHKAIYNFLSSKNLNLNVMTEMADFELHPANHSRHKDVHGSFLTQAHTTVRTNSGKTIRISYWASKIGDNHAGWANATVDSEPVFVLGPHQDRRIDNVYLRMDYASLHVHDDEFEIIVQPKPFRLERNVVGMTHRLDLAIKPRVAEAAFTVPPHGIIGQGWDGDNKAIDGERDEFPESGEFTTYAMAKGAIEGTPNDYKVATPFATDFKYSRFGAASAEPRNAAKLVAAGILNAPKDNFAGETVGSTEITEENM